MSFGGVRCRGGWGEGSGVGGRVTGGVHGACDLGTWKPVCML